MGVYDITDMGLGDAHEPYAVDADKEYELRIIECTEGEDKNGLAYILPRIEVVGEPYAKDFTHFLHLPNKDEMDAKKLNRVQWALKNFLTCFGMGDTQRINFSDELPGCTGWAILGKKTDEQYGEQNFIKKLIQPR